MMRGAFIDVGCTVKTKPLWTVRGEAVNFTSYFSAAATLAFFAACSNTDFYISDKSRVFRLSIDAAFLIECRRCFM